MIGRRVEDTRRPQTLELGEREILRVSLVTVEDHRLAVPIRAAGDQ
jgi:hypothetical protein